jgi:hypothetical protein
MDLQEAPLMGVISSAARNLSVAARKKKKGMALRPQPDSKNVKFLMWERHLAAMLSWLEATPT